MHSNCHRLRLCIRAPSGHSVVPELIERAHCSDVASVSTQYLSSEVQKNRQSKAVINPNVGSHCVGHDRLAVLVLLRLQGAVAYAGCSNTPYLILVILLHFTNTDVAVLSAHKHHCAAVRTGVSSINSSRERSNINSSSNIQQQQGSSSRSSSSSNISREEVAAAAASSSQQWRDSLFVE